MDCGGTAGAPTAAPLQHRFDLAKEARQAYDGSPLPPTVGGRKSPD
jgi:hypothetical protein